MPIPQLSKKPRSPQDWRKSSSKRSSINTSSLRSNIQKSREMRGGSSQYNGKHKRPKSYKLRRSYDKKTASNLISLALVGFLAFAVIGMIYLAILSRGLPSPNKLIDRDIPESTKIYDRTGETILYEIHGEEKRTIVNLEEIPEFMKQATIAAEDRKFYEHSGFNLLSMFKGVIIDPLMGKRARGGSTLTQQLVKNAILTNERKISRKIKEFVLSYRIEKQFAKDEILQMYFNEIPYGSTAYGIESASRRYFGLSVRDINLSQAAILAALPQAPSYYSPYGTNKDGLFARQEWILDSMEDLGYINEDELEEAKNFNVQFKEPNTDITAPHFVMYVKEILSEKYGEQVIEQEGLKIYTTLDLYKQEIAEEVVSERGEKNANSYGGSNSALVSIDPKTGQILAMVGSRDYFNDDIDGQVNIALRPRQPGSSLKPLVYAMAFAKEYTPNTILYDVVTNFAVGGKPYEPHNYDLKERGPVTIRSALAGSLNIPAVKALYLAGPANVVEQAQKMGYTTLTDPERYGLSLVLGGGEVKLLEHTAAYGVFAREGDYYAPSAILKIEDRHGKVLEEYKPAKKTVMPAELTRLVNDILSDNDARAYAFGANNWLTLSGRPVAAKTGTTNDYRDGWTMGYTPSLVTGVWVGNNDNSEMNRGSSGSRVAAPIWNEYMRRVLGNTPVEYFKEPKIEETGKAALDGTGAGEIKVKIDKISGLLATEDTPPELIEEKLFRQPHSLLYYVWKDDPRGDVPGMDQTDPQFPVWEEAIKVWAEKEEIELDEIPTESDNVHNAKNIPQVSINSPDNNFVLTNNILNIDIDAKAPLGIGRAEYYIDDYLIEMVTSYAYDLSTDISYLNNGNHKITIKVCDTAENCWQQNRKFNLVIPDAERDTTLSFAWSIPTNNSTVKKSDFPLQLKTLTYKPSAIQQVKYYYHTSSDSTPNLITTNSSVNNNEIISHWSEAPGVGTYFIYAEATGWNGNSKITGKAKINITE